MTRFTSVRKPYCPPEWKDGHGGRPMGDGSWRSGGRVKPRWSEAHLEVLRGDMALRVDPAITAKRLGRTRGGVIDKARALGIMPETKPPFWTAAEDEALRDAFAKGLSAEKAGQAVGRSRVAAMERAKRLGIWTPKRKRETV